MRIAVVTFDGFNEIDSFVTAHVLNRVRRDGWKAEITCPTETVESLNGVRLRAQRPLEFANEADAVLFGSGRSTARVVEDASVMARLRLDPRRQLVGSQCSGALVLAKLGLLGSLPVCTDLRTRPLVEAAGVEVLDQTFFARGNVASVGGCLGSPHLATWVIWRLLGRDAAADALAYVAPVGERTAYVADVLARVAPYVGAEHARAESFTGLGLADARAFAARWLPAWTGNDPERLVAFYTDDAFYADPAIPDGVRGRAALLAYFRKLLARNPDWVWTHRGSVPLADGFLNEWHAAIPAGATTLEVDGVCTVQLRDGRIYRNQVYFDRSPWLAALRAAKP